MMSKFDKIYESVINEAKDVPKGFEDYTWEKSGGEVIQSQKTPKGNYIVVTDDGGYYKHGAKFSVWYLSKSWTAPDPNDKRMRMDIMKVVRSKAAISDQVQTLIDMYG
jgi:hypothetical protein